MYYTFSDKQYNVHFKKTKVGNSGIFVIDFVCFSGDD